MNNIKFFENIQCEYAGHSWTKAGGGLEICIICHAEQWQDDDNLTEDQLEEKYGVDRITAEGT